jgi:hypothetical protein
VCGLGSFGLGHGLLGGCYCHYVGPLDLMEDGTYVE